LKQLVQTKLNIHPYTPNESKRRLLDMGGGTGVFTRILIEHTNMEAVVVDPYLPSEYKSSYDEDENDEEPPFQDRENNITYVSSEAEAFVNLTLQPLQPQYTFKPLWWQYKYDIVLFKEDDDNDFNLFTFYF